MTAYLAGSIFYAKDIMYNAFLAEGIRKAWPGIDMYVPQEATINDKTTFADSKMIYDGDYERLKNTDLFIACMDGDCPPIGTTTEAGIFSELAKQNPEKKMVILHTDTRDAFKTLSDEKVQDMKQHQCASQFNYFNLFTRGTIETCGIIVSTAEQLFEYVHQLYTEYRKTHHASGIYLITNRLSGKEYIGQSVDVYNRLNSHRFLKTENSQAIDLAIRKYGIENFTFKVLEFCEEDKLNEREKYWADTVYEYKTYVPKGYNLANAGEAHHGAPGIIVSSYELNGKKIKTYKSKNDAADSYNITFNAINQAIKENTLCQGLMWAEGDEPIIDPYCPNPRGLAVRMYDKDGEYIRTFDNITRASEFLQCTISQVATGIHKNFKVHGYYFTFNDVLSPIMSLVKTEKTVYQYDKVTHKLLNEYPNHREAARSIGGDESQLGKTCKGVGYYMYGYIWSYIKWDEAPDNYRELNKQFWAKAKEDIRVDSEAKEYQTVFNYEP